MWFNLRECEKMVAHEDRGLAKRARLGGCLEAGECVSLLFLIQHEAIFPLKHI